LIASPRNIKTSVDGSTLIDFSTGNASTLQSRLQATDLTDAQNIITYVRGESDIDTALYRNRTVTYGSTIEKIWRLGDIVSSTPRVVSWMNLNNYQKTFSDTTYQDYLNSNAYRYRGRVVSGVPYGTGMVFTGANDGMLHAFNLGALEVVNDTTTKKASLKEAAGVTMGEENWAFIPKNALPYLKYLMDKDYCHLYYIDATPVVFDASIGTTGCTEANYWDCQKNGATVSTPSDRWRTILIGGMRLGGACKAASTTYGVQAPLAGEGYSSYFALDITDPTSPTLLWEFSRPSDNDLGFTTTGPAIVRINARDAGATSSSPNKDKNGRWFVVFASGPTGPITNLEFKGYSGQNLKLFILDLKTGALLRTIDTVSGTAITYAYGGSLNNGNIDFDLDYQDDAVYFGYTTAETKPPAASTEWTNGGVLRLITREDLNGNDVSATGNTALNPSNWDLNYLMDNTGPVSSAVAHLTHIPTYSKIPDTAWLYFGSGRYLFREDNLSSSDILYSVKDPCLSKIMSIQTLADPVCDSTDKLSLGDLDDATTIVPTTEPTNGWYINLDPSERVITDPLASKTGAVFFTTFAPDPDICKYGGESYLWAMKYNTGGSIAGSLKGKGLLQVSTGVIEEINLKTAFTGKIASNESTGRRSAAMQGVPPTGTGLSIVSQPPAVKRVVHIRER
jgi:type IV pilus assembly protein PilY1